MEVSDNYTLEFLPLALNDITEIVSSFVMLGSKQGAIRIKDKINKAAEQILHFPYSGVTVPDPKMSKQGFRMIVVEKYLMFYRIFEDEKKIIFYRVLNGKRDYPILMNKLYEDN
ncbi:MAG: type II toxin-antitoxin system RelE/ParE family toxin [Oscillospiraceae bacterium]|nr:type II toxin-antitoxin system RelE/ParE family toxin [Oscillospiraceae bacterium]MBR2916572.1 type II toxin-antitoxin system RelE/ParE family toxin [Clostridia bacterium]MBR3921001.1 type II toxin-antitoxin system RelE/ParE family toxin [Oscillospiraceae bacterium]